MSTVTIGATLSEDVSAKPDRKTLRHPLGRSPCSQIKKLVGKKRTVWYIRVKAGRAPQPDKPGSAQYSNANIIEYAGAIIG